MLETVLMLSGISFHSREPAIIYLSPQVLFGPEFDLNKTFIKQNRNITRG